MENRLEKRFRLRQGDQVVGYMRQLSPRMILYSKDGFWWRGEKPEYNQVDEYIGLRDRNNQAIYEWDIVDFKYDPEGTYKKGVILWEGRQKAFGIKDLEGGSFIPLFVDGIALFQSFDLKVYSHLYLNPELKVSLGVRDQ